MPDAVITQAQTRSGSTASALTATTYIAASVSKTYGGVRALDNVDIEIRGGEVQALLGANGAGKSTLVKVLVGAEAPDEGTLSLNGAPVHFRSTADAAAAGVGIVSQELNLFPELDVLQNIFMLREPRTAGLLLDRPRMAELTQPVMAAVGLDVALDRPVRTLRLAERQLLEITRSLLLHPHVLFLDEPTSALGPADTQRLLEVVRGLRDSGVAVVYVSHFLEDVFAIADTVTVLRNGRAQEQRRPAAGMSISATVTSMLGDAAVRSTPRAPATDPGASADPASEDAAGGRLVLDGVTVTGVLAPLNLAVIAGEVVGLAGLEGSGATTVVDTVFGRQRIDAGSITLPGGRQAPRSMAGAVKAGVAYVPADRKAHGVMLDKAIQENVTLVAGGPLRRMGVLLRNRALREVTEAWRRRLSIAMSSPSTPVGQLSGGNQQKVVFAKWLETEPSVVLLDDPTRGVDVGAKVEMHAVIKQLAQRGRVVLVTSSDLAELAEVSSRVVVFFGGRAVGELSGDQLTEHELLEAINIGRVEPQPSQANSNDGDQRRHDELDHERGTPR